MHPDQKMERALISMCYYSLQGPLVCCIVGHAGHAGHAHWIAACFAAAAATAAAHGTDNHETLCGHMCAVVSVHRCRLNTSSDLPQLRQLYKVSIHCRWHLAH